MGLEFIVTADRPHECLPFRGRSCGLNVVAGQPHRSFKTQTFTSFYVTTNLRPRFYILTAPFSSWLDTMMIYHQMSLRGAIGNASALCTTCIHKYMSDALHCLTKIKAECATKKCRDRCGGFLTPWRVFLQKLILVRLVKRFNAFYETQT